MLAICASTTKCASYLLIAVCLCGHVAEMWLWYWIRVWIVHAHVCDLALHVHPVLYPLPSSLLLHALFKPSSVIHLLMARFPAVSLKHASLVLSNALVGLNAIAFSALSPPGASIL